MHPIAWLDRELARERTAHDQVAGLDMAAELRQLARQPDHRVQGVAEYRVAASGCDDIAVDLDGRGDGVQCHAGKRHRITQDNGLLLRIVCHGEGDLRGEIAAGLDDLECRIDHIDRGARRRHADLAAQRLVDPETQFGLEPRADQFVAAEHVPGSLAVQDAAEHRFVETELLLDRFGGQANLPTDLSFACAAAARDDAQLDAICVVERQAVEPFGRKEFAACTRNPEAADSLLFIERHLVPPGSIGLC